MVLNELNEHLKIHIYTKLQCNKRNKETWLNASTLTYIWHLIHKIIDTFV